MSLFRTIMSKIFPGNHPAVAATPQQTAQGAAPAGGAQGAARQGGGVQQGATVQQGTGTAPQGTAGAQSAPPVDVEKVLNDLASKNPQKLNWRTSIVDLMKLLDMDSSLSARKELARELGYNGDTNDSATMNIWLHKQVMRKLAENGGKVPDDLRS
jgi:hypothetical protein